MEENRLTICTSCDKRDIHTITSCLLITCIQIYGLELILMILGTIGSALACNTVRGVGVITMLSVWRLVVGIGIGGDYPLSAVITSEYANVSKRYLIIKTQTQFIAYTYFSGMMIAAVFAMQGVGILFAGIVSLITIACFKKAIEDDPLNSDYVWRILLVC
jgi:PHS family inorganic phosphate transporter-like MFS transporter